MGDLGTSDPIASGALAKNEAACVRLAAAADSTRRAFVGGVTSVPLSSQQLNASLHALPSTPIASPNSV